MSRGAMGLFSLRSLVCAATVAAGTLACAGRSHSDGPSTEKTACAEANDYVASCGATNWTSTCHGSDDEECEAMCELQISCAYFLGQNPVVQSVRLGPAPKGARRMLVHRYGELTDRADRLRDMVKGLVAYHRETSSSVGPLMKDYEYLADLILRALDSR